MVFKPNRAAETGLSTLYVPLRYVILPLGLTTSAGNIGMRELRAQHSCLNLHFAAFQSDARVTADRVVPHYPYRPNFFGNPNIQFGPAELPDAKPAGDNTAVVVRLLPPTNPPDGGSYSSLAQVQTEFYKQGGRDLKGTITVYITKLTSNGANTLLGQAGDIPSNQVMIHYGTVGSAQELGAFATSPLLTSLQLGALYAEGKTLIHEIGHCLGLYHPFQSDEKGGCAGAARLRGMFNPQSPVQYLPNYGNQVSLDAWPQNALDNRGRDALIRQNPTCNDTSCGLKPSDVAPAGQGFPTGKADYPFYSCMQWERLDPTATNTPFETFFLFLDYAADRDRIGFSSFTADLMRQTALNSPEIFLVSNTPIVQLPEIITDQTTMQIWLYVFFTLVAVATLGQVILLFRKTETEKFNSISAVVEPTFSVDSAPLTE